MFTKICIYQKFMPFSSSLWEIECNGCTDLGPEWNGLETHDFSNLQKYLPSTVIDTSFISVYIIAVRIKHSTNLVQRLFENRDKLPFNVCFHKNPTLFYSLGKYQTSRKASTQASTDNLFLKEWKQIYRFIFPSYIS